MSVRTARPIVGIPASVRRLELDLEFHGTALQYLRAVREEVNATVFTIPGITDLENAFELLDVIDGLLLTGSFSNIHPLTYGEEVSTPLGFYDQQRDAVTMPLIREAINRGIPIFGICRGMQEMNVAFGGSLHQVFHEAPGMTDHRPDGSLPLERQFDPAHDVEIKPDGVLAGLIPERRIKVSTAHMQGVKDVAPGLRVEAVADDGAIEALSVEGASSFALGVQFHPEWDIVNHPLYNAMFRAFRAAVEQRQAARQRASAPPAVAAAC